MIFIFPQMHPDLLTAAARAALPQSARFIDPGLADPRDEAHARPTAAPFDARTARAILADTLRFGESVASPRDIAAMGLAQRLEGQAGALDPESSRAVQAEVERRLLGESAPEHAQPDPQDLARRQAQTVLLLAWSLEERLLELRGAEARVQTAWSKLGESVAPGEGEPDDEADHESMNLGRELSGITLPTGPEASGGPGGADAAMPWRKLLECCAALAPEDCFATAEAEIAEALAEAGAPEAPLTDMPGAARVFRAPVWRMLGLDRVPEAKPWLAAPVTLGVYAPKA